MFYEYAIDPEILSDLTNIRTFFESFRNRPSRLISDLPKKWIQDAFCAINKMPHEDCPPVMRKTLKENLRKLSMNNLCNNRAVEEWDRNQGWVDYALTEHQKHPFSAILSSDNEAKETVYSFSNLFYSVPAYWDSPTQLHVKRNADEMITAIMPLLRVSKIVLLVDPHFSFTLPSWDRYRAILQKLIELSGEFNYGKGISSIDIHTSDRKGGLQSQLNQKVRPFLPVGITIRCFQWPENQMHDRFILTDVGGVSFGHGLDEHTDNNLDEVLVSVLEYQAFKKEKSKLNGTPVSQSLVAGTT
jgi:hypothetical protein